MGWYRDVTWQVGPRAILVYRKSLGVAVVRLCAYVERG